MEKVKLYGTPETSFTRAVLMVCEEKGVAYELTLVMPHTPEVLAIHPFGKVPVMRHGEVALCESKAIVAYLDGVFPKKPAIPREVHAAAETEQWISLVNSVMDRRMVREYVLGYVFPKAPTENWTASRSTHTCRR
jgi:glutathione S-transferase